MEKNMENTQNNTNQQPAGIMIHSQYIKDMSLEIPLAPEIFKKKKKNPGSNNYKIRKGSIIIEFSAAKDFLVFHR